MLVCIGCVCFSFSALSQEIGWEERLQNDLYCVGWDVGRKTLKLNQCCSGNNDVYVYADTYGVLCVHYAGCSRQ